jgi:hypothetical protein
VADTGRMCVNPLDVIELQTAMYGSLLLTAVIGPGAWSVLLPLQLPAVVHAGLHLDWRHGVPLREGMAVLIVLVMLVNALGSNASLWAQLAPSPPSQREPAAPPPDNAHAPPAAVKEHARPPCAGRRPMARQLGFIAAHVTMSLLSYRAALGAASAGASQAPRTLQLLLLLATVGFAGDAARLLAARIGHIPPPRVSRCLAATAAFGLCVRLGGHAPAAGLHVCLGAIVCAAGLDALGFFVRTTRAVSACIGLHPFRTRGAKAWNRLT